MKLGLEVNRRAMGIDEVAWISVALALLALRLRTGLAPSLGQDSFQYISVAQNALGGLYSQTSLVHFDAERSFGVVPAPMVTFPPGYAFAMAALGGLGLPLALAGLLLSAVSMAACVPLLAWMSARLGLSRLTRNLLIAAFVVNASVITMGANVASDALFTVLALCAVALLTPSRNAGAGRFAAAGVALGLAYTVRYAGLFFIVGVALLVIRHLAVGNRAQASRYGITLAVATVFALVGTVRNILLVGTWRGGNEKVVSNPLGSVALETLRGANRLFFGPGSGTEGGTVVPRVLLLALLLVAFAWAFRMRSRRTAEQGGATPDVRATTGFAIDLLLLVAAYAVCLFYAGWKSVIDYGDPRYIAPLLPMVTLLAGVMLTSPRGVRGASGLRVPLLVILPVLLLYAYLNLLVLKTRERAAWLPVADAVDGRSIEGPSIRSAVHQLTGKRGTILANNGQTIGHLLERPTVSLVGPHFSTIEWDEESVRRVVKQFGAKAIVIQIPTRAEQWENRDLIPSTFVKRLASGESPSWMRAEASSDLIRVYAITEP